MITDKHRIIYATDLIGYENPANLLHEILEVTLGIDVPVSSDTRAKSTEYEILIGHTNRPLSHRVYEGEGAKRLIEYYYTQTWDGKLPETVVGEGDVSSIIIGNSGN